MKDNLWLNRFINEGRSALEERQQALGQEFPWKEELLQSNELFRLFHSLRSQAEFLQWQEPALLFLKAEEWLSRLPESTPAATPGTESFLQDEAQQEILRQILKDGLIFLSQSPDETDPAETSDAASLGEGPMIASPADQPLARIPLGAFEGQLLKEARERGETPYRLVCRINREEEIPFARFFVIISHLEEILNVVKVFPDLEELQKRPFRTLSILITTTMTPGEIRQAVDVDNLERLDFSPLSFQDLLSSSLDDPLGKDTDSWRKRWSQNNLTVTVAQVESLGQSLREIRHMLWSDNRNISWRGDALKALRGMERVLSQVETLPLAELFNYLPDLAAQLSQKTGKDVEISTQGGDLEVDWTVMNPLFEILLQLIRNAADHGIEDAEGRKKAGKDSRGHILINAARRGEALHIQVIDDGKGIALKDDTGQAMDGQKLLDQLARPGYSSLRDQKGLSGRGFGLDIALRRVEDLLGGRLTVNTTQGEGTVFQISLPDRRHLESLTLARSEGQIIALSSRSVLQEIPFQAHRIRSGDGGLYYPTDRGELPLYTPLGRIMAGKEDQLTFSHLLVVTHLGVEGLLGVDEILEERDVSAQKIRLGWEKEPNLQEVNLEGYQEPVLFVFPALVSRY